jgi:hypothetical protein
MSVRPVTNHITDPSLLHLPPQQQGTPRHRYNNLLFTPNASVPSMFSHVNAGSMVHCLLDNYKVDLDTSIKRAKDVADAKAKGLPPLLLLVLAINH